MRRQSFGISMGLCAVLVGLSAVLAGPPAAPARPGAAAAAKPVTKPEPPAVMKLLLAGQVQTLEADIAALAQRRVDVAGAQAELLELMIDLRILARTTAAMAIDATPETDMQIAAMLRTDMLTSASAKLNQLMADKPITALTPKQSALLKTIHAATFQLNDLKTVAQLDAVCSTVGSGLAELTGQVWPGAMRPDPVVVRAAMGKTPATRPKRAGTTAPVNVRTLPQLEAEARQMSVSPGLRRQLLALARGASEDPGAEQAVLSAVLADSVDLAAGLAGNFAVDPDTRQSIEAQLAEGIALFLDTRLRPAGQKRLDALNPYRRLLSRVGRMKLPPELLQPLASAFTWARVNGPQGEKVLAAIERFTRVLVRAEQLGRNPDLTPGLQKATDALDQKFKRQKQDFVNDAQQLGGGALSAGPEELAKGAAGMELTVDALDLVNRLPVIMPTLGTYRPRLALGFQKRIDTLVSTSQNDTPAADEAVRQLKSLDRLTQLVQDLSGKPPVDLASESVSRYGGEQLPAFDKKCQAMIGDIVQEIPTATKMDESRLDRLTTASNLRDALQEALLAEVTIRQGDVLRRWADWSVTPAQLATVLGPYQHLLADALAGFVTDHDEPVDLWKRGEGRYAGVINLLKENAAFLGSCQGYPEGLLGESGKLMTAFDNAPFSRERSAGFMLVCWAGLEQWGQSEEADALSARLARKLGHP